MSRTSTTSAMLTETQEAPTAVARLLDRELSTLCALGRRLAALAPNVLVTCARGSSDHAALYLKYVLEISAGVPVASMGPSIASVYGVAPLLSCAAVLTISQSGRSPDLVAFQAAAQAAGALTIGFVNVVDSPVAAAADVLIPLHAGPETSVAATKSFIVSVAAGAALVAAWIGDSTLMRAVEALPETLSAALMCDWSSAEAAMSGAPSSFVVGRGPGLAIASEAALKFKEVVGRHAEAFSLAEVMHGPMRLIGPGFPVLALLPEDRAAEQNRSALAQLEAIGAAVFVAGKATGTVLPIVSAGHPLLDPLAMVVPFYLMAERMAWRAGFDPDRPNHLRKVTETR